MPDQMGRTPFGEPARSSVSEFSGRSGPAASQAHPSSAPSSNFNSLADALKVATALSDQRRSLQAEIATALDKSPRGGNVIDPLGEVSAQSKPAASRLGNVHPSPNTAPAPADTSGPRLPGFADRDREQPKQGSDDARDLLSFDFGTVVPQRESPAAKSAPTTSEAGKPDSSTSEEPRIVSMHARGAAGTVAPFPRPVREAAKPETSEPAGAEKPKQITKNEATGDAASTSAAAPAVSDAASAQAEALLDAVVDMVQQQPASLSVFTSGASFIGGIAGKKHSELVAAAAAAKAKAEASAAPGAPPKLDGAAAELLRPMLRQWLADNMPRIVEDALRSEMTAGDKGPGKS
jgi:cell pole-organizing protein PopZ